MMDKFNKYDVNSDGMIDSDELVTWVFGPKNADKKAVQKSVDCFVEKFGSKGAGTTTKLHQVVVHMWFK